ncbi:multiple sugar transport system ATP-binding protein [Amycolatopsis arida]|uniref:Multiple sugar transport system ATP-binding protein n=1 Tax=Amycolatopsis arida TaxID=587909 RepID=A0A1I5ZTT6_9PSEU|nr:ABC transporter ATP-binding protein [Amycolatopsis arida]TDX89357.1 multiple sugar transport system ATP-binding protein [Amycolatopsis arida]SFQ59773.1 multiple sugar transport system ATP-binding protein [Amycolatopsis arida]
MADVVLHQLVKEYPGGVRAVDELDLAIADGEFFALLGPSGCGKTTLLRSIAGLETVTSGRIELGGRDVTRLAPGERDIAMVFQDYALFPHMSVRDNIAYPLRIRKMARGERHRRAEETARGLSLGGLLDRRPGQLSGGQQQRAALARAVACHPRLFLFDEPLSNLDARLRLEARTFLKRLQRDLGVTTVFVTHDQAEALALSDRMAVMDAGRIRQIGTPTEVFQRPASTFVAGFIGSTPMNLLDAVVDRDTLRIADAVLPVPDTARPHLRHGEKVVYAARPEYLTLTAEPPPGALGGVVAIVENLGVGALVTLEVGEVTVQATVPEGQEPPVGACRWVVADPARVLVYRAADGELVGSAVATEPASAPAATG